MRDLLEGYRWLTRYTFVFLSSKHYGISFFARLACWTIGRSMIFVSMYCVYIGHFFHYCYVGLFVNRLLTTFCLNFLQALLSHLPLKYQKLRRYVFRNF